jgi:hypothetical protein
VDITDELLESDEISAVPEAMFATDEFISRIDLGLGEDVFMIGMFADVSNGERNSPFCRFGNIARMAVSIKSGHYGYQRTHVVDMRSRTGFSGSPVWVFRTPSGDFDGISEDDGWTLDSTNNLFVRLLGVHCGQFPEVVKAYKSPIAACRSSVREVRGDAIKDGDELWIPSGMTTVVPASRISELLNAPQLEAERRARENERQRDWMKMPWPEAVSEPPTTEENPRHKEDFNRLLDAAARKPKQDDQT